MTKMRDLRHQRRSPVVAAGGAGSFADAGLQERSDGDADWLRELDPALAGRPKPTPKGVELEPRKATTVRRGSALESRRGNY